MKALACTVSSEAESPITLKGENQTQKTVGKAEGWLSNLEKSSSIAEEVELPYGISLAGTPSQPQKQH